MKFQSFIVLASLIATSLAATVEELNSNIVDITKLTGSLDSKIVAFPNTGGSLTAALAIHSTATELGSYVFKATSIANALPKPVADSDAQTILDNYRNFEPVITKTMGDLVAKKTAFAGHPIGGIPDLISQDLKSFNILVWRLAAVLLSTLPAVLATRSATGIKIAVDTALNNAIIAYG